MKLILLVSLFGVIYCNTEPLVKVKHGNLAGSWKVSTNGRPYASFQGVPYARPPVGKYRFREPQRLKPWTGVWDAKKPLSNCLQYDPFVADIVGNENCLFVNVYTPNLNPGTLLPVLVFIHGGAFMYGGSSLYDVAHLMDKDLVVVTLNYRLGPLGFLSTGDEVVPGNAGLKDQAFALQWVKQNIMSFGGNPDSVTLTGSSAGGASVHYHYLSPLSKGTFARGISFSGSALAPWTHAKKPAEKAKNLAAIVGCPTTTSWEMADCLKYRPGEVIVRAQLEMFEWKVHMFTPFIPTTEVFGSKEEPFITQYPYRISQSGAMAKVPLIATVTSEEGLYPAAAYQSDPSLLPELESQWSNLASHIFEYNDTLPIADRPAVAQKIKQKYLGGRPVGQDTFPQLVQALGDRLFVADVGKLAQIHAAKSGQPTYVYRFAYRPMISLSNLMARNTENYGVSHADDLFLFMKYPGASSNAPEDKKMTQELLNMLYSYASTGVPTFGNAQWAPVQPGSSEIQYLEISSPSKVEMKRSSDFGQRSFWDSLGLLENENYHMFRKDEL